VKIVRLLRLAKLKIIFDKIDQFLQLSSSIAAVMSFFQLSVFVLFWSHWLGCIFHFIAQNEDYSWLDVFNLVDEEWHIRYVNSIYWGVTTMITVGYGDISPQTPLERTFGIFFLLVACGVFSFTLNTIGNALQTIDQKKQTYRKRITNINNYMKRVGLQS
jgi:hyperpolarization activated cyclic nucleotide-gated potassium channel 2